MSKTEDLAAAAAKATGQPAEAYERFVARARVVVAAAANAAGSALKDIPGAGDLAAKVADVVRPAPQAEEDAVASTAADETYVAAPADPPTDDDTATRAGEVMSQTQGGSSHGHGTIRLRGRAEPSVAETPVAAEAAAAATNSGAGHGKIRLRGREESPAAVAESPAAAPPAPPPAPAPERAGHGTIRLGGRGAAAAVAEPAPAAPAAAAPAERAGHGHGTIRLRGATAAPAVRRRIVP